MGGDGLVGVCSKRAEGRRGGGELEGGECRKDGKAGKIGGIIPTLGVRQKGVGWERCVLRSIECSTDVEPTGLSLQGGLFACLRYHLGYRFTVQENLSSSGNVAITSFQNITMSLPLL